MSNERTELLRELSAVLGVVVTNVERDEPPEGRGLRYGDGRFAAATDIHGRPLRRGWSVTVAGPVRWHVRKGQRTYRLASSDEVRMPGRLNRWVHDAGRVGERRLTSQDGREALRLMHSIVELQREEGKSA